MSDDDDALLFWVTAHARRVIVDAHGASHDKARGRGRPTHDSWGQVDK